MAQRYLVTRARTAAAGALYPGTLLDDAQDDVAAVVATGARTYLAPNSTIADAAELCARLRLRGGIAAQAESIMLEAAARADVAAVPSTPSLAREFIKLGTDFSIAPEPVPDWHDVLSLSITTTVGTKLEVFASVSLSDAGPVVQTALLRVLVDDDPVDKGSTGVLTGVLSADEAESGTILADHPVVAGSHVVKLQAQNGNNAASTRIAALSLTQHHASLRAQELP